MGRDLLHVLLHAGVEVELKNGGKPRFQMACCKSVAHEKSGDKPRFLLDIVWLFQAQQ
jgi:hypothetical protein